MLSKESFEKRHSISLISQIVWSLAKLGCESSGITNLINKQAKLKLKFITYVPGYSNGFRSERKCLDVLWAFVWHY